MTASSCKAIVLPQNVPELDPTNGEWPPLNYPKSRIGLASVLAVITSFWRISCTGTGRKSLKMNHCDPRRFKAIPDLPSTIFFYTSTAFDYFFFYFNLIIHPPAILPCSQNWEKARREWQFWLEGKLMMVWGRRWGSLSKVDFFLFFRSWLKRSKEELNPHSEHLWSNWLLCWQIHVLFSFGKRKGGGVNNFRVTLVYCEF